MTTRWYSARRCTASRTGVRPMPSDSLSVDSDQGCPAAAAGSRSFPPACRRPAPRGCSWRPGRLWFSGSHLAEGPNDAAPSDFYICVSHISKSGLTTTRLHAATQIHPVDGRGRRRCAGDRQGARRPSGRCSRCGARPSSPTRPSRISAPTSTSSAPASSRSRRSPPAPSPACSRRSTPSPPACCQGHSSWPGYFSGKDPGLAVISDFVFGYQHPWQAEAWYLPEGRPRHAARGLCQVQRLPGRRELVGRRVDRRQEADQEHGRLQGRQRLLPAGTSHVEPV